jgi:hypothetical protein
VDDARVGQGGVDQADILEIRRQLVSDARRSRRRIAPSGREIELAKPAQFRIRPVRCAVCERWRDSRHSADLGERIIESRTLAERPDFGMAGQDLFDQAGTRARHPEYEHRQRRRIAGPLVAPHPIGVERAAQIVELAKGRRFIVFEDAPLQFAARDLAAEGTLGVAAIGTGLGERKMQIDLVGERQRLLLMRQRLERGAGRRRPTA